MHRSSNRKGLRQASTAVGASLRHLTRRVGPFISDRHGTVAILFGLTLIPVLGTLGAAVDYSRAVNARTKLTVAVDAALLTAAREAADTGATQVSEQRVDNLVHAMTAGQSWFQVTGVATETVSRPGDPTLRARARAVGRVSTAVLQAFGRPEILIASESEAAISHPLYTEIHFVVDVSASMGLAADDAGRQLLKQKTREVNGKECTFACHMKDDPSHPKTNLQIAQDNNIRTRIDVVRSVTGTLLDDVKTAQNSNVFGADLYRVGLYSFSGWYVDWGGATTVASPTSNVEAVRPRISSLALDNATAFQPMLADMTKIIGKSDDGSRSNKRKQFMILMTDGHDYGHDWNMSRSINPAWCDKLKKNGVDVYVFNTMWVADWGNWAFDPILGYKPNMYGGGTVFESLGPKLRACSSGEGFYHEGTDSVQISSNFRAIFRSIQERVKLSR